MSSKQQTQSHPQPQAPPQQEARPPYAQGSPPYQPPPSGKGIGKTLSNAIVVIVIIVIISLVIYSLISGLITSGTTEPGLNIYDGVLTGTAGEWRVEVASVTSDEVLNSYMVSVLKNSSIAISVSDISDVKMDGASGDGLTLSFYDVNDDNKLNEGDYFILNGTDTSSNYQVVVYWKTSGNKVSGATGIIEQ